MSSDVNEFFKTFALINFRLTKNSFDGKKLSIAEHGFRP
ncbi:hypothetical protein TREAZ_0520 [Leadbettera azotonutricia ZAS-9]|uniref:Uncharacterized protein n=1 Tax=Leadbettera azotonutricia (strain ATCC BAA-888 / DSM 13862 / ZAS-9) TaxID=545695 RepID=F5YC53_LEAAZ|nr:hypothetical protein TREAZ_0520 [Leadbettera azotonutricia ZAS-9]